MQEISCTEIYQIQRSGHIFSSTFLDSYESSQIFANNNLTPSRYDLITERFAENMINEVDQRLMDWIGTVLADIEVSLLPPKDMGNKKVVGALPKRYPSFVISPR